MTPKKKKYMHIVVTGEANNYGFDYTYIIFSNYEDAESYLKQYITDKLKDFDYSDEEIQEELEGVSDNYMDAEYEFTARIEKGELIE